MKKCPFCKADIEDNARFCLYCMKPLNEKEVIPPPQRKLQWWPFVLTAVLLVVFVAVMMLLPRGNGNVPNASTGEESSSTEQSAEGSTDSTQSEDASQIGATTEASDLNQKPTQDQNPTTQKPTENPTSETKPPTPTIPDTTPTGSTTAPESPKTEVVYTYRAARAGDDFNAQYQNTGNDIVITGISQPSVDGTYDIPSYIDGKKVIAIVANAFSGSNAKIVYIPATVKTIWNYAFAGCGLTDLYFRGNAIYTESSAFSGSITIHCSATCSDRNYRYYKNSAANYGATWAEWNG